MTDLLNMAYALTDDNGNPNIEMSKADLAKLQQITDLIKTNGSITAEEMHFIELLHAGLKHG